MKLGLVGAFLLLLVASAQAQEREPAPPPQDPSVATIRGDVIGGFFGTSGTRIAAIDGKTIYGPEESCARHDLAPGPHSIVVANKHSLMPLRLDAVAGATYVVREPDDDVFLIEEVNSGETVFRMSTEEQDTVSFYSPSFGDPANTATIRIAQSHQTSWLTGNDVQQGYARLHTVDGKPLPGKTETVTVEAGKRAIAFYMSYSSPMYMYSANPALFAPAGDFGWWQVFPLLLDVEAGHSYAIELGKVKVGNFASHTTGLIVDDTTGQELGPRFPVALNAIYRGGTYFAGVPYDTKVSFPEGKGQLKRTPPKPKQWCERED